MALNTDTLPKKLDQGCVNVANAFLQKVFGGPIGHTVAASKSNPGSLVVNIDSNLLSMDCINKYLKIMPEGVTVKSVAIGTELHGDFDSIRKLINICKNNK
ncbi:MAG: hypothetical protein A2441_02095 [Candidatus Veblenbacteria bacterium RIFOXYC2_FULL_42_11]|uniref:Uncharacterized protein n=2 Tax=Candidatus Vebleniibacteriota TaxID=1817921 RepID=A0A1G2QB66_9BACT|nr:MAG: hypothetical protein A2441_02095 [Candidatus Veblenbacteria bacterium RIFOXYC2_FULL_42_11]OHA57800.1 MAG: hypothetical protein A2588_02090 [Candidatus Veblenbacteria bacterium RIFOXYD1_FULL_43_11]